MKDSLFYLFGTGIVAVIVVMLVYTWWQGQQALPGVLP